MRVFCANGKQYLYPQVIATCSMKWNGHTIEETLFSAIGGDVRFIMEKKVGVKTPFWKIFSPRVSSQRTYYRDITEDEAKTWLKKSLSTELCNECLKDYPFTEEEQND